MPQIENVQEAVYHCLPELWLPKVFPGVIYANTNIREKRFRVLRSQNEIGDLPDDSNDIFKRNMLEMLAAHGIKRRAARSKLTSNRLSNSDITDVL